MVILTFFSCRKDVEILPEIEQGPPVYAGVYDSSFYYFEYPTPLTLTVTWDSQNLYGFGIDSIDLNNDNDFDIIINMSLLNSDSTHLLTGLPDPFPSLWLTKEIGYEFLVYSIFTYAGMGTGFTSVYVKDLNYGTRIDTNSSFGTYQPRYVLWQENPTMGNPPFGNMYNNSDTTYMALKFDTNKYGWIKVDMTENKNPKFLSFAVQL